MDTATRVQILDETDSFSHSTNTLGKGMNPIILLPETTVEEAKQCQKASVRQGARRQGNRAVTNKFEIFG